MMMKYKVFLLLCVCILQSCKDKKGVLVMDDYPVEHCKLDVHRLDSGLVAPQNIHVFKDKLLVMEPKKKVGMLSVFDRTDFRFLCSGIDVGHAKNETTVLRGDYFACTDTSFYVLDTNVYNGEEKEYRLRDNHIEYVGSTLVDIPDAINQLLRVGDEKFISSGFTSGEGHEHLTYYHGHLGGFGEYPEVYDPLYKTFFQNGKASAGMMGKDRIWDFYSHRNLIRSYDLNGNLLVEMEIVSARPKKRLSDPNDRELYFHEAMWNSDYIAVFYNDEFTSHEFYSLAEAERGVYEVQLWTWDGELKRRIKFDRHFDFYALSADGIFYAMDEELPDVIYTYDIGSNQGN